MNLLPCKDNDKWFSIDVMIITIMIMMIIIIIWLAKTMTQLIVITTKTISRSASNVKSLINYDEYNDCDNDNDDYNDYDNDR